mgnify:FL=1|tara:strand:+ start:299 stop:757 length:459 start_codon:yes stop_codon:yes gene_type:complete
MKPDYVYRAEVTRVVDGDTVDAIIDLGFAILYKERIRLMGIDTPESRTRNRKEKALGLASKARLKALVKQGRTAKSLYLQTSKDGKGKFGRILGTIWADGINANEQLIAEGHARPYFGGSKNAVGEWTREIDGEWERWTSSGYVPYDTPMEG